VVVVVNGSIVKMIVIVLNIHEHLFFLVLESGRVSLPAEPERLDALKAPFS
jgi:hypothetical protein